MRIDIHRTAVVRIGVYGQGFETHWGRLALTLFTTLMFGAVVSVWDGGGMCRAGTDIQQE